MEDVKAIISDRIINRDAAWFGMVPAWICEYADKIGPEGLAIFTVLCIHANKERRCFPSYETLAKETGAARSTVAVKLKQLQDLGLIKKIQQGGGRGSANLYEIVSLLRLDDSLRQTVRQADGIEINRPASDAKPSGKHQETVRQPDSNRLIEQTKEQKQKTSFVNDSKQRETADYFRPTFPISEEITDEQHEANMNKINEIRMNLKERGVLRR